MELMIAGYAQKVQFDESMEVFHQIPQGIQRVHDMHKMG